MQVHFINYNTAEDFSFREVVVQSLKLDNENRPYCIVSNPFEVDGAVRAEYVLHDGEMQWVADLA